MQQPNLKEISKIVRDMSNDQAPKADLKEISKIVRDMSNDQKQSPNYNAIAAKIVQDGVKDKIESKYNYQTKLSGPQSL